MLLAVGLYQIAFSGHVPVGRLTRTDRNIGVAMVVVGVLWLEAMHWWVLTPTYPAEVNRYWYIFWPTMLLGVLVCSSATYAIVGLVGEQRQQEQRLMLVSASLAIVLMVHCLTGQMLTTSVLQPNCSSQAPISSVSWSVQQLQFCFLPWSWRSMNRNNPSQNDWTPQTKINSKKRVASSLSM